MRSVGWLLLLSGCLAMAVELPPNIDEPLRTKIKNINDVALVIGNEDYGKIADVPYASRDADAFESFLIYTKGLQMDRVKTLKQASATAMMEAVTSLAEKTMPGSNFWIYYAGHGIAHPESQERILLGWDAEGDPLTMVKNGISVGELQKAAALKGARVFTVIDACYNGVARSANGESILSGARVAVPSQLITVNGIEWGASQPSQVAIPLPSVEHGAFTYLVLGALRGWADGERDGIQDGIVTLEEAHMYVKKRMSVMQISNQVPVVSVPLQGGATEPSLTPEQWAQSLSGEQGASLEAGPSNETLRALSLQQKRVEQAPATVTAATPVPAATPEEVLSVEWTSGDDAMLDAQVAQAKKKARDQAIQQQDAAAAEIIRKRQSTIRAEWEKMKTTIGDPEDALPQIKSAVEQKLREWKNDAMEVPGNQVPLPSSVAWKGREVDLAGKTEGVPAKRIPVSHAEVIAEMEAWLRSVPAQSEAGRTLREGGYEMIRVMAGTFSMGSPPNEAGRQDDEAQHSVALTQSFELGQTEVTQRLWTMVMGSNPSIPEHEGVALNDEKMPVFNISYKDMIEFLNKLSEKDGYTKAYLLSSDQIVWKQDSNGYRLPTEAEWEYAARAGNSYPYSGASINSNLCLYMNLADITMGSKFNGQSAVQCNDGYSMLSPVKKFSPNNWGFYDMSGNVWEMVWDGYGPYSGNKDPTGVIGAEYHVVRGGSAMDAPAQLRVANREHTGEIKSALVGLRIARTVR